MVIRLPQVINEQEFIKIIENTTKDKHKLAFGLAFFCGLRISEVCKLQPGDVDLDRNMLFIRQAKGNKDRYVPIPQPLRRKLSHLPIDLTPRALELALHKISLKSIGKRTRFHSLRHSAATLYLSKGMNIREVQQLLGHSRLDTTMIYTHVSPDDIKRKMDEVWK